MSGQRTVRQVRKMRNARPLSTPAPTHSSTSPVWCRAPLAAVPESTSPARGQLARQVSARERRGGREMEGSLIF